MNDIEIYTTAMCGYCAAAKNYLHSRGLAWREMRIDSDPTACREMRHRAPKARTVPQIFVNGTYVGGYDDMMALVRKGEFDRLLKTA